MFSEYSRETLEALPESSVYPVVLFCLLLGSSFAFGTNHDVLGAIGVSTLGLLSLVYGALQMPERI
ncbi:MAG: hypothetical protein ABEJ94_10795 [Halorientalis sp.]